MSRGVSEFFFYEFQSKIKKNIFFFREARGGGWLLLFFYVFFWGWGTRVSENPNLKKKKYFFCFNLLFFSGQG